MAGHPGRDAIALGEHLVDLEMDVRERPTEHPWDGAHPVEPAGGAGRGAVVDVVSRVELRDDVDVALVDDLLDEPPIGGLVGPILLGQRVPPWLIPASACSAGTMAPIVVSSPSMSS